MSNTIDMGTIKDLVTKHLILQMQFYDDNYNFIKEPLKAAVNICQLPAYLTNLWTNKNVQQTKKKNNLELIAQS